MAQTTVCIAGAGPAGAVLAFFLARCGVDVALLEARARWVEREFRGNTLNPSAISILEGAGLGQALRALPHVEARRYVVQDAAGELVFADFGRLGGTYDHVMMLPQSPFLELVVREASRYPNFRLVMGAKVRELIEEDGAVRGVRYRKDGAHHEVRAALTVGADGRFGPCRKLSGLEPAQSDVVMDVLWWRVPRAAGDPRGAGTIFRAGSGVLLALMDHDPFWQVGFIITKGTRREVEARGLEALRTSVSRLAPELGDRARELPGSWGEVELLPVVSDRLRRWHRPGLLLIGDAAHAASPIGGVGINLAVQDAAAAAEELAGPLLAGRVEDRHLARVQRRREPSVRIVQGAQDVCQRWVVSDILRARGAYKLPRWLRLWYRIPVLRDVPTRLIAYGALRRPRRPKPGC